MSGNGNGFKALAAEMTATGERTMAWAFRGLIIAMLGIIGWFGVDKLNAIDKARDNEAAAVDRVTASEIKSATLITRLDVQLSDYIRNQDYIIGEMIKREADHEDRLRHLERPPR